MSVPPMPLLFAPLFKVKPWGGRRLAELFHKPLPAGDPIGESWELVSLPENESRVCGGPLAGRSLAELVALWGTDLIGQARSHNGRFPLLIKFLDARENLSVQVHPKPAGAGAPRPGVKHEMWYVIDAQPGAKLYIGLKPGVRPTDVARAAGTSEMADLLRTWPATPGACYALPSGTPHALGGGVVVTEVQTPSDVTYRLYDWDRVGLDGRPRALHLEQALANVRYDVTEEMIRPPAQHVAGPSGKVERLVCTAGFSVARVAAAGASVNVGPGPMRIWILPPGFAGGTTVVPPIAGHSGVPYTLDFAAGDVVLLPAGAAVQVTFGGAAQWLEVTVP